MTKRRFPKLTKIEAERYFGKFNRPIKLSGTKNIYNFSWLFLHEKPGKVIKNRFWRDP